MKEIKDLERMASQVRRDIVRMVADVSSGHPGGSLGATDIMTALYFRVLRQKPTNFTFSGENEDVFLLSNGHISPVWYSVLARSGFFPVSELGTFRLLGSRLQGHPTPAKELPGIRMASGSLGQGLSNGIGYALSKNLKKDDKKVYVLMGDGETQEGQVWEAALYAGAKNVGNIVAMVDWNNQQIDGSCDQVVSMGDYEAKWKSFGWDTIITNGNNMEDVVNVLESTQSRDNSGRPLVILFKTEMGQGVDFMCGTNAWHGKAPSQEQKQNALGQLEETFGDYTA